MKIYKHTGNGHYIGSCIIVLSENRSNAEIIIVNELNKNGLGDEELNIEEIEIQNNLIILSENGDY